MTMYLLSHAQNPMHSLCVHALQPGALSRLGDAALYPDVYTLKQPPTRSASAGASFLALHSSG